MTLTLSQTNNMFLAFRERKKTSKTLNYINYNIGSPVIKETKLRKRFKKIIYNKSWWIN